jgi:hypothetical protein
MCVLRVSGTEFDADKYSALSALKVCGIFHRGEPRFSSKPDGKIRDFSGFNVSVSDASWERINEQVNDAIAFLKENKEALMMLRAAPGVEDMDLDFAVDLRIDRINIVAQCDYFPPDLVSLAGAIGLGIEISIYPQDLELLAKEITADTNERSDTLDQA